MRARRAAIVIALLALFVALDACGIYVAFTSRYPGANDFYPRWRGARAFWLEGLNPYSDEVTLLIQEGIYGRPARPDEDPGSFVYPFYTVFLIAPLTVLPYAWAEALWLALLQVALLASVLLTLRFLRWSLPSWLLALTAVWSLLFYHGARALLLGQFAVMVFLAVAVTLWALHRGQESLAGISLALSTVKPQMTFLLIPFLLLWGLRRRRWAFLCYFLGAMALLVGLSFLLMPSWFGDFLIQVIRYPSYTPIGSPIWIISHYYFPSLGVAGELALSALLLVWLFYLWFEYLWKGGIEGEAFYWTVGMTLVVTNLVALRTATTNYVVLYMPLLWALKRVCGRSRRGAWALASFYCLSVAALWPLFLLTVRDKCEHPIMYLPLPFALLIALFIMRPKMAEFDPGIAPGSGHSQKQVG